MPQLDRVTALWDWLTQADPEPAGPVILLRLTCPVGQNLCAAEAEEAPLAARDTSPDEQKLWSVLMARRRPRNSGTSPTNFSARPRKNSATGRGSAWPKDSACYEGSADAAPSSRTWPRAPSRPGRGRSAAALRRVRRIVRVARANP